MVEGPLVEAVGVERTYQMPAGEVRALRGVDLAVSAGEVHVITGPSGSGKSSMVYLLGALDRPSAGVVRMEGRDLATLPDAELSLIRRHRIGFIFQAMNLLPTLSALENVLLPAIPERPGPALKARAAELLERVGLGARVDHPPDRLSGGEQQRVAVARALLHRPSLILADEPTGELDTEASSRVMALMRELVADAAAALVVVTHDPSVIAPGDRHHVMTDGLIVDASTAS